MTDRHAARVYVLRAVGATVLALAGLVVAGNLGALDRGNLGGRDSVLAVAGSAVLLVAGSIAVRWYGRAIRVAMTPHTGENRAAGAALLARAVGYVLVVVATLGALDVHVENLLLSGAVTGIIIGIAAQQVLANFFAGIVLLVVRPFAVGEELQLRAGTLGAEYDGMVVDMSAFYVTLDTERGRVAIPNSSVLAAAIGPGTRPAKETEPDTGASEDPPGFGLRDL
jgi:small-conductance mechanosensitive channel